MARVYSTMIFLAIAACSPALAQPPAASALFPENPALDIIAPSRAYVFKQETWTELSSGGVQHCHEWAFPASEETSLRDEANRVLTRLGIAARFGEIVREAGYAFWL